MIQLYRVALITLPILSSGSAAMALEDNKVFPGAMCQPVLSTDQVLRSAGNGRMENQSGHEQAWICPLVHDAETADGVEFAAITVIGQVGLNTCNFHSMRANGSTIIVQGAGNSKPDGNNTRLQFASGDQNIGNTKDGYYYFACNILNNSGVMTYTVDENENEG